MLVNTASKTVAGIPVTYYYGEAVSIQMLFSNVSVAAFTTDERIIVDDKFIGLSEKAKDFTLLHEVAHILSNDHKGRHAGKRKILQEVRCDVFAADSLSLTKQEIKDVYKELSLAATGKAYGNIEIQIRRLMSLYLREGK